VATTGAGIDASLVELVLNFSGDCWTEVTDADGRQLFFDLGSAGSSVTVSGAPPLRVLLGDRGNVSLQVNGVDYPISGEGQRLNTAKLTINPR
jgi:cytoskeleton protein RodZ